ncbi:MAG: hypothetical protein KTR18_04050 [Acidiferrobacterales bacterium]|nr:hypothetical protein [Acidiferrobacterales bacterium]
MDKHHYLAYGLVIGSDYPIDCLTECKEQNVDITIRRVNIRDQLANIKFTSDFANWQATENRFHLHVCGVADYLVSNGNEIQIEVSNSASDDDVNAFLISSAFAALLQQRHFLTLHASAVMTELGALLLVGRSGVGKSTTLSALTSKGYSMVTDDIAAVTLDENMNPTISPSYPVTKLKPDAIEKLGKSECQARRLRKNVEKYLLPVDNFHPQVAKVHKIFLLDIYEKSEISTEYMTYSDSFYWLSYFTFRKRFYTGMDLDSLHFKLLSTLIQSTDVVKITRSDAGCHLEDLVTTILGNTSLSSDVHPNTA